MLGDSESCVPRLTIADNKATVWSNARPNAAQTGGYVTATDTGAPTEEQCGGADSSVAVATRGGGGATVGGDGNGERRAVNPVPTVGAGGGDACGVGGNNVAANEGEVGGAYAWDM